MADIKIPNEELANLLSVQILASLSEQTRNDLVEAALHHLISKPPYSSYGPKETPLQLAFNDALTRISNRIAEEVIEAAGINDKLTQMFQGLLADIPDIYHDWDLQCAVFKAVMERAKAIRNGN